MKVLIIGSNGQVGSASNEVLTSETNFEVIGLTRSEVDIADRNQVLDAVSSISPDFVLNAAALTNVDLCESEVDLAFAINALGVRNIAQACSHVHAHLIHISTDFVFDGKTDRPYSEYDLVNPLSVYAKSKYGGDVEALQIENSTVLRVAWVFGNPNGDFFSWVHQGLKDNSIESLIDDQVGSPTYSYDIAQVIKRVIAHRISGLINVANTGQATRLDMGNQLIEQLGMNYPLGGIKAESLNRPAPRPSYSALSTDLLKRVLDVEMRSWQEALSEHIKKTGVA